MDDHRPLDKVSQFYSFRGGPVDISICKEIHAGDGETARPKQIVSNSDTRSRMLHWTSLMECLGMHLDLSTAYHLQTDGQSEHTIQTLKDILRACAHQDFGDSRKDRLYMKEFSYNISYQASIKMAPS